MINCGLKVFADLRKDLAICEVEDTYFLRFVEIIFSGVKTSPLFLNTWPPFWFQHTANRFAASQPLSVSDPGSIESADPDWVSGFWQVEIGPHKKEKISC